MDVVPTFKWKPRPRIAHKAFYGPADGKTFLYDTAVGSAPMLLSFLDGELVRYSRSDDVSMSDLYWYSDEGRYVWNDARHLEEDEDVG